MISGSYRWFNIICNNNDRMGYRTPNIDRIAEG